jgi:hypothetical protein
MKGLSNLGQVRRLTGRDRHHLHLADIGLARRRLLCLGPTFSNGPYLSQEVLEHGLLHRLLGFGDRTRSYG